MLIRTPFVLLLNLCIAVAQVVSTITAVPSTVTITAATLTSTNYVAAPTTPPSPQYTDPSTFRETVLNSTNYYRYEHSASYLAWNDSLASYAQNYSQQCIWAHSHGPPGENLARGYPTVTEAVDAWGNERALYNFSGDQTGFTEETGHFTQLVWKSTQTVGCGATNCGGRNNVQGWLLVCEYWPAGNIEAMGSDPNQFFLSNVGVQANSGQGINSFSATAGASGVGTSWATGSLVPTRTSSAGGNGAMGTALVRDTGWLGLAVLEAMLVGL